MPGVQPVGRTITCRITRTGVAQGILANTNTTVDFDTVIDDTNSLADLTNDRINIPVSGVWLVTAGVRFATGTHNILGEIHYVDASAVDTIIARQELSATTAALTALPATTKWLKSGGYVYVLARTNLAEVITVNAEYTPILSATFLGP